MAFSLALHIVGIVFWLGGLIVLTRVMSLFSNGQAGPQDLKNLIKRLYLGFVVPGLLLTTLSGLYQFFARGWSYYMIQTHWFHSKLTLVVVLYVVSLLVWNQVKKISQGVSIKKATIGMLHGFSSLILLLVVFITLLSR